MAALKRKDKKGRNLNDNEDQIKDGRYRYRYTDKNGVRHAVYSWRLKETDQHPPGKRAKLSLRELEKQIEKDQNDNIDGKTAANTPLNYRVLLFFKYKRGVKEQTLSYYVEQYKRYCKDTIGLRSIKDIKYTDIQAFYNSLIDKGVGHATIEILNITLNKTFEIAIRDQLIRSNPCKDVMKSIKWQPAKKKHALSIEEQQKLINYTKDHVLHDLIVFLIGTGCRIGEATALCWNDIDFVHNNINIHNNLRYIKVYGKKSRYIITTPKTPESKRTIPLLPEIKQLLLEIRQEQLKKGETVDFEGLKGLIFYKKNKTPYNSKDINSMLKRIVDKYNYYEEVAAADEGREIKPLPHITCHTFRHTFATRLCEEKTDINIIKEVLGHTDIKTTLNIYTEATENAKQEAFKSLDIGIC